MIVECQRTSQKKRDSHKWVKSNKTQVKGEGQQLKRVTGTYDYIHTHVEIVGIDTTMKMSKQNVLTKTNLVVVPMQGETVAHLQRGQNEQRICALSLGALLSLLLTSFETLFGNGRLFFFCFFFVSFFCSPLVLPSHTCYCSCTLTIQGQMHNAQANTR